MKRLLPLPMLILAPGIARAQGLVTAPGEEWKTPRGFVGKPHYFSRSFHNGEEMRVAVSYKEPIEQKEK